MRQFGTIGNVADLPELPLLQGGHQEDQLAFNSVRMLEPLLGRPPGQGIFKLTVYGQRVGKCGIQKTRAFSLIVKMPWTPLRNNGADCQ